MFSNLLCFVLGARVLAADSTMGVLAQHFKNTKVFRWLEVILVFVTGNSDGVVNVEHVSVWLWPRSEILEQLSHVKPRVDSTMVLSLKTTVWLCLKKVWLVLKTDAWLMTNAQSTRTSSLAQTLIFIWFIYCWNKKSIECLIHIPFNVFLLLEFQIFSLFKESIKNWSGES